MPPGRDSHLLPFAEGIQTEIQQPLRLLFLGRNQTDNILVQALRDEFLVHVCHESVLVFLA